MKYFLPDGRGGKPAHFPGENIRQQPQFALTNGFRVTRMKKNIAFFDFDGTITHEDTFTPFIYQSLDAL
jgi:energy-converting hydrogenase Eha subunit F